MQKGSKELVNYYETGDLSKIGVNNKPLESKEKGIAYFESLINIIKIVVEGDEDDDLTDIQNENGIIYSPYDYSDKNSNIFNMFGKYDENEKKFVPINSTLNAWEYEYKYISAVADINMKQANDGFKEILTFSSKDILDRLNLLKDLLSDLRSFYYDIKSDLEDIIYEFFNNIELYGNLGSNLVFIVFLLMNIFPGALILFLFLFSEKITINCSCCKYVITFFIHLFWNILALLMIISFLLGFVVSSFGTIGEDFINIISFVLSEENLGKNVTQEEGLFFSIFGEIRNNVNICINGDGELTKELYIGMKHHVNLFYNISNVEDKIEYAKQQFEERKKFVTYKIFKELMESRIELKLKELFLVPTIQNFNDENQSKFLQFHEILEEMNYYIERKAPDDYKQESWKTKGYDKTKACTSNTDPTFSRNSVFSPLKCKPIDRDWIPGSNINIKGRAKILSNTIIQLERLNGPYLEQLETLKMSYDRYLTSYIEGLDFFNITIKRLINSVREYIDEGDDFFSLVKCNFIGINLKILLKYLKTTFGKILKVLVYVL